MAKTSILEMFLALLSDDERKQLLAELSTMALNGNNLETKIKQKVPLAKQLPEGVDAAKVKKISIYPHYIPKGYTAEDVEYDDVWRQYVIRNKKKATLLVYIPIHTVLDSIPFFTQQYREYGEIGEYHLREFVSQMYRSEAAMFKVYSDTLHQHFMDCLSVCPKIKGVWIVSAYPTITAEGEIQFLDTRQIEHRIEESPYFNRIVPFSEEYLEKFHQTFPEYRIVPKNIYYALVAYVIKKFYEYYMSSTCCYNGNLNIYFTFLLGAPATYLTGKKAQELWNKNRMRGWSFSSEPNILHMTYLLEFRQKKDSDFYDYCRTTCNIPLGGPVSIAVEDEENGRYIETKRIHALSSWKNRSLTDRDNQKVGLLVDEDHVFRTSAPLVLPITSFIAMLKED